ncbi:MAG: c-type cytochrome [Nitrospiria bacterium]
MVFKRVLLILIPLLSSIGCVDKDIPLPDHPGGQIYSGIKRLDIRCYRCHGKHGQGTSRAPALVVSGKTIAPEEFVETVLKGKERMPRFESVLTEDEILQVIDWLEKIPPLQVESAG